ncbi:phytoene desaturase family protein [Roseivirga pacifica]
MKNTQVLIIGSGMGALVAGAMLTKKGLKTTVLEQNYLPGGCTSAYWRKGFVFETGATTLVGLGNGMPLQYVLDETGIELNARRLDLPMRVHLSNGLVCARFEDREQWIKEAERVFGAKGQRQFWEECYRVSDFVWETSLKQLSFPPNNLSDLIEAVKNASLKQVKYLPHVFKTVEGVVNRYGLHTNKAFVDFVNEQLLISAQNHMGEVNFMFGAAALCYTNLPNYYIDGGLINLVQPFVDYIESNGGEVNLREGVRSVVKNDRGYEVESSTAVYKTEFLISDIPINNTLEYFPEIKPKFEQQLMSSDQLNSAFQLGIGFKPHRSFDTIHHQIHLSSPLEGIGSKSIFISLNHPDDLSRTDDEGLAVMSVSTHWQNPAYLTYETDKLTDAVIDVLVEKDFLKRDNIVYQHSSGPKSWQKWTGRKWGGVGGYPQFDHIKPWQMLGARLDGHKAYQVGDTVYPGQGIPGVTLSGIIAAKKLLRDWSL